MRWNGEEVHVVSKRICSSIQDMGEAINTLFCELGTIYNEQPCNELRAAARLLESTWDGVIRLAVRTSLDDWAAGERSPLADCKRRRLGPVSLATAESAQKAILAAVEEYWKYSTEILNTNSDLYEDYVKDVIIGRCTDAINMVNHQLKTYDYSYELAKLAEENLALIPYTAAYDVISQNIADLQSKFIQFISTIKDIAERPKSITSFDTLQSIINNATNKTSDSSEVKSTNSTVTFGNIDIDKLFDDEPKHNAIQTISQAELEDITSFFR